MSCIGRMLKAASLEDFYRFEYNTEQIIVLCSEIEQELNVTSTLYFLYFLCMMQSRV